MVSHTRTSLIHVPHTRCMPASREKKKTPKMHVIPRSRNLNFFHQLLQLIVIIPSPTPPIHHNLLLFFILLLRYSSQYLLELFLRDFLADLAGSRKHNKPVFNVCCAGFLDEADAAKAVGGFGEEDLREDRGALVGCAKKSVLVTVSSCASVVARAAGRRVRSCR